MEAQQYLLQCAQAECPRVVRNDCATWANEVSASTPSLVLAVRGSQGEDLTSVRVFANDKPMTETLDGRAIALDPGVYKLRFEADGHSAREQTVSVREGEKMRFVAVQLDRVDASLPPVAVASAPASETGRTRVWSPLAISLGSVAVASGAAALGVGLWGKQQYDDVRERCGRTKSCSDGDVDAGKRAYIAADVLAGVAAASAVAAVWVFVHDNREHSTTVSAVPSRDGMRVALSGAF